MKSYRVIIFDWDGTLMDSDRRIVACLKAAAARLDLPILPDQTYRNIIGLSLFTALETLYPNLSEWQLKALDALYRWQWMEANETTMSAFSGLTELLMALKEAGYVLAIATGKSRPGLELALAESGVGHFFDITKSGEETACKPDPLMLQEILAELSLDASQALMVGDSRFDLEMAQAIAMPSVAMTHGVHEASVLANYQPLAFFDDLPALQQWLLTA